MTIINITKENFDSEVKNYNGKVLVDFWATWCAPCKMLSPIIDEIAEERSDIKVCKADCDNENCRELAMQFGIMSIPTLLVFENGNLVNKSIGLVEKQDIIDMLRL